MMSAHQFGIEVEDNRGQLVNRSTWRTNPVLGSTQTAPRNRNSPQQCHFQQAPAYQDSPEECISRGQLVNNSTTRKP